MTRVLIIGGTGMLGHKLVQRLSPSFEVGSTINRSFESVERCGFFDRERTFQNVDVTAVDRVKSVIDEFRPHVVINAVGVVKQVAASTDVETALMVNSIFPHRLARLGGIYGFRLITISTDCVFSGTRGMYGESDPPDALDLYGQSKHWGELVHGNCLTLRTSIIGRELGQGHGLIEWFLSQRNKTVRGYSRAFFSGFPTLVFADILIDIIEKHPEIVGVFHVSSCPISKYELLNEANARLGANVEIVKDTDFALDRSLDCSKFISATGFKSRGWDEMIEKMASDETPYDEWKDQM